MASISTSFYLSRSYLADAGRVGVVPDPQVAGGIGGGYQRVPHAVSVGLAPEAEGEGGVLQGFIEDPYPLCQGSPFIQ